jgi:hypothetical protein
LNPNESDEGSRRFQLQHGGGADRRRSCRNEQSAKQSFISSARVNA